LLRGGSKEREIHSTPALCAHDDEIGQVPLGGVTDLAMCAAEDKDGFDLGSRPRFLGHQLAQSVLGVRSQRTTVFRNVEGHRGQRPLLREPLDHVQERDPPVSLSCQVERKFQCQHC
jgi:hypothetical protein